MNQFIKKTSTVNTDRIRSEGEIIGKIIKRTDEITIKELKLSRNESECSREEKKEKSNNLNYGYGFVNMF